MGANVNLSWTPPTVDADGNPIGPEAIAGYSVFRSDDGIDGPYNKIANTANVPAFTDNDLADGVYFYKVAAKNADLIDGDLSVPLQVGVHTPAALLGAPTSLNASVNYPS